MIIQGSPEILQGPRGLNNQFGAFSAAAPENIALNLIVLESVYHMKNIQEIINIKMNLLNIQKHD